MLLDSGEEHQINERWEQGRLVACSLYSCILFAQGSDIHRVFFAISAFCASVRIQIRSGPARSI